MEKKTVCVFDGLLAQWSRLTNKSSRDKPRGLEEALKPAQWELEERRGSVYMTEEERKGTLSRRGSRSHDGEAN